jgi:hypothetical protein
MPAAIATDKGNVYWLNLKSGEVMVRARKGGEPKVLAREQKLVHQRHAPTLVATDGTAYYLTQTTLNRVSAAGGEPEVLLGGLSSPTALLLDGKTLFFCQSASAADAGADAGSAGGLYQLAPRAKAAKLVAKLERPTAIAVDASQAYVVDASSVVRVRKTGGEPTVLASSTGQLGTTLAVDQHSVYYTLPSDDSVMQAQKRDGSSAVVAMERERPVALALSGTALYSLTETTPRALGELGTVWRAATDTAGQPEALVIDEPGLNGLAVAEGDVYYTKWDESAEDGQVVYVNVTTHTSRDAGTVAASAPKK